MLVTTNLCARGIDVEQVTVVVNYDVPVDANRRPDCETYLHRWVDHLAEFPVIRHFDKVKRTYRLNITYC